MPPLPGEERLVTLFADIHYYFAQPTTRPVLHRFDKASYFYIYFNSTRHTSRVEVANNPGTADQDAFNGYLDTCRVINSYKFPTLVTLIVNVEGGERSPTSPIAGRDPDEWRLVSGDPRDTGRAKYKLHTLDIYFWTQEDAKLATDFFRKLLEPAQLDIVELDSPAIQTHPNSGVSSVVQNLEQVAISDPAYRNGQTRNSQNRPQSQSTNVASPPPPPMSAKPTSPSVSSEASNRYTRGQSPKSERPAAANFTPMAYNPAAPAAPEPIAHREKTPPPEDAADGTGLAAAAMHDHAANMPYQRTPSYSSGPQPNLYGHYGSPPPPPPASTTPGYGAAGLSGVSTAPPPSVTPSSYNVRSGAPTSSMTASPAPRSSATSQVVPSFAPPPQSGHSPSSYDPHRHSIAAQTYTPEMSSPHYEQQQVETPGTQFYNTVQAPHKPLQHVQPQYADYLTARTSVSHQQPPAPSQSQNQLHHTQSHQSQHSQHHHHHHQQAPPGGYSDYSYSPSNPQQQQQQQYNQDPYDSYAVHNQVYRPTEQEASSHGHHKPSKSNKQPSVTEEIDRKASKYLDKMKKRFG